MFHPMARSLLWSKNGIFGVSGMARSARGSARAHFWCAKLESPDVSDAFWLLDRYCSSKSRKNRIAWNLTKFSKNHQTDFEKIQNFWNFWKNSKFSKIFEFWSFFKFLYFRPFWCHNSDQVVQKHLRDQENTMACAKSVCAQFRARCAPKCIAWK